MASPRSLATLQRLEEHEIVLLTPTEELKSTSIIPMCIFSSDFAYLYIYMLLYVYIKVGPGVGLVPMHPSTDL